VEATLKYHPGSAVVLTLARYPCGGPRLVGSLTGAVASQSVTEAPNGSLRPDGNRPERARAARELDCEADKPSRGESRA
jgi:Family of unknown function (DUF6467)